MLQCCCLMSFVQRLTAGKRTSLFYSQPLYFSVLRAMEVQRGEDLTEVPQVPQWLRTHLLVCRSTRGPGFDLCWGRSLGEMGNLPQYSCLENFRQRSLGATVCGLLHESDMMERHTHTHTHAIRITSLARKSSTPAHSLCCLGTWILFLLF